MLAIADPDLDSGPRTEKSATVRMCAVSRKVRPIDELIRFVVSPSGEVVPDLKRKLPGRGLWVSASHRAVAEAVRRNHFSSGFKRDVRAAATLADDTEALLVQSTIDALAIAAKAGQVVSGFGKVEATLTGPRPQAAVAALIRGISDRHRTDISTIGFGTGPVKCDTCCAARGPGEQDIPVAQPDPGPIPDGGRRQDCRRSGHEF